MAQLTQNLRKRLVPAFREILAFKQQAGLTFNRLSGAVLWKLEQAPEAPESQLVDQGVDWMSSESLPALLQQYDAHIGAKREQANRQVMGIINNLIAKDTPNRDVVIQESLEMLEKFPLVRSIQGIRALITARIENGHKDLDEDEFDCYAY